MAHHYDRLFYESCWNERMKNAANYRLIAQSLSKETGRIYGGFISEAKRQLQDAAIFRRMLKEDY
jgi:hypothetical protein